MASHKVEVVDVTSASQDPSNSASKTSRGQDEAIWLILILALGVALRLWGLRSWAWDGDELYTLRDARDLGSHAVATGATGVAARPVYYLLQHLLLGLLPETRFFLRLPAFVFGVAGIWATWWLGRRVFGQLAGLLAALVCALSPWHLYASQFARYWSLVYLLATLGFGLLLLATDRDRPASYLLALVVLVLGGLTHPTFGFPVVGVAAALHLVDASGHFRFVKPTRNARRYLWIPLASAAAIGLAILEWIGRPDALQNAGPRGLLATIRLVPAMVQWAGFGLVGAAAGALLFLFLRGGPIGRKWAVLTILGVSGTYLLLLLASLRSAVYSDYGLAALPLILVAVAGGASRLADHVEAAASGTVAAAAAIILALATAPETLSHLSDGSRYDFQPAFEAIRRLAPDRPVAMSFGDIQRADAPDLRRISLERGMSPGRIRSVWMITSSNRFGIREGGAQLQSWIDWHCRPVLRHRRPRIDFRVHQVDLYWCGDGPPPGEAQ